MLLSGMVFMLKEDENGHQSFLNYMLPGELFGESFSLRKKKTPSHVSFLAARNATALFLPLGKIMRSCEHHCRFHRIMNENLYELLAKKNAHLMQTLDILSKDTLRDKILSYLQLQPIESTSPKLSPHSEAARTVSIPLNKSELAHYLNVNRTSLCRELAAMEKDGILTVSGNRYSLLVS